MGGGQVLGGGNIEWNEGNLEARLVELGLESLVYSDVNERRRRRKDPRISRRPTSRTSGADDQGANVEFMPVNLTAEQREELYRQVEARNPIEITDEGADEAMEVSFQAHDPGNAQQQHQFSSHSARVAHQACAQILREGAKDGTARSRRKMR